MPIQSCYILMKFIPIVLAILIILPGCTMGYAKYQREYYDIFDTVVIISGYARSQSEFDGYSQVIHEEMLRLHKLFDIYNDYYGLNNLKTVNDSAGTAPVKVDEDVITLLERGKTAYLDSGGAVNIAMGSVLRIWHEYRSAGLYDPYNAALPPMDRIVKASGHTDMSSMFISRSESTVYLSDPEMSLDVGGIAKGYAMENARIKAMEAGFSSGIIYAGGSVAVIGTPKDGREYWNVGIQNPYIDSEAPGSLLDTLHIVGELAVDTSGDYQRFYLVNGEPYSHIIDPKSLMPAARHRSVTVLHPDCSIADMLSIAAFILPTDEGHALIERYGAQAVWVAQDGIIHTTSGYEAFSSTVNW